MCYRNGMWEVLCPFIKKTPWMSLERTPLKSPASRVTDIRAGTIDSDHEIRIRIGFQPTKLKTPDAGVKSDN